MRREYSLMLTINGRSLNQVLIDDHYEKKHGDLINDPLVLELVRSLNGKTFPVDSTTKDGWEVYVNDPLYHGDKPYRLVWCLHADEKTVGIINVFRRRDGKVSK